MNGFFRAEHQGLVWRLDARLAIKNDTAFGEEKRLIFDIVGWLEVKVSGS
jgi:hypothetical protein